MLLLISKCAHSYFYLFRTKCIGWGHHPQSLGNLYFAKCVSSTFVGIETNLDLQLIFERLL